MATLRRRLLMQLHYPRRMRLVAANIVLLFLFITYWQGWFQEAPSNAYYVSLDESSDDDPSLHLQKIHSLERQVRQLRSALRGRGLQEPEDSSNLPIIYIITPTYARPNQLAELHRLRAVLLHVSRLWWVLVEDSEEHNAIISSFLKQSGLSYTHLAQPTPQEWKLKPGSARWKRPRGVLQRNAGIAWLRANCSPQLPAVLYFADDDNSYSIELFQEMRGTLSVSVWPVGLVGGVMVERPVCDCQVGGDAKGQVIDWLVGWKPYRKFPTDMAGFAVSVPLLLSNPEAQFSFDSQTGYLETDFLNHLVDREDLEPKADCCTKVLVWHMNAKAPMLGQEEALRLKGKWTDEGIVV